MFTANKALCRQRYPQQNNRGGASEASVATLTDYVAGAQDLSYVRQALRLIALRACAMVAESAMSETFFSRKENLAKKI